MSQKFVRIFLCCGLTAGIKIKEIHEQIIICWALFIWWHISADINVLIIFVPSIIWKIWDSHFAKFLAFHCHFHNSLLILFLGHEIVVFSGEQKAPNPFTIMVIFQSTFAMVFAKIFFLFSHMKVFCSGIFCVLFSSSWSCSKAVTFFLGLYCNIKVRILEGKNLYRGPATLRWTLFIF